MDINKVSKLKRSLSLVLASLIFGALSLSTYYYRSFQLNPVAVWHGANMGVRSLLSDADENPSPIDNELMSRISEKLEKAEFSYSVSTSEVSSGINKTDFQIKNQIAATRERNSKLERDIGRLDRTNQQLLSSKLTLEALNQDYSNALVYSEVELARQAEIEASLDSELTVPSEKDAEALLSALRPSRQVDPTIPEVVLDNVQKTTGISADEINELMNQ